MSRGFPAVGVLMCFACGAGLPAAAQTPPAHAGPPVLSREQDGRTVVRATRLTGPLRIDGTLDEPVYRDVAPASDFIQAEPLSGPPPTQPTEVWILFDGESIYVSVRCWEQHLDRMVADELRRDSMNIIQSDHFGFALDTFYDRRNAVIFNVTPEGARFDGQITDERQLNTDWNPVWRAAVGRFEGGWSAEMEVPFKSIRYRPGSPQVWGFQARRDNKWMNEISYLTVIPRATGSTGLRQVSAGATLVGVEVPDRTRNLEIKPFAIANLTSDFTATPRINNNPGADAGLDVKYGITQNLTADFTYNTDFAQVEADEQQVNLTRFSLFFPEKREFFLENQGTFNFGGAGGGAGGAGDTPILFYSRRIGLALGRSVPIAGGGRLTGRVGRYSVGVLNLRSNDEPVSKSPATTFGVVRVKRDLFRRSSIGAIATYRSAAERMSGDTDALGVDGTFAFFDNLNINTYFARTRDDGPEGNDASYRTQLDYAGDRYGLQLEHLLVGDRFSPDVGFVRRDDMRRSFAQFRFSPRPRASRLVRKYSWTGSLAYVENVAGRLETRDWDGQFAVEFHNADRLNLAASQVYEFLPQPFRVGPSTTLPVGGYDYGYVRAAFTLAQQRRLSGTAAVETGTFYNGRRTTLSYSQGRFEFTSRLSMEPNVSTNWIAVPQGAFTTNVVGSRVTYTMTPLMFVSALLQYTSSTRAMASNVRFRWEYRPGSELFAVYNDQRDTLAPGFPGLLNRAFIVKMNRLFRF